MINKTANSILIDRDFDIKNISFKKNSAVFKSEDDEQFYNFKKHEGMLYVRVHAVQVGENSNGDYFSEPELKKSYKTFIGKGNYVNHQSNDVEKKRGKIIKARYIDDGNKKFVECIIEVDAGAYPKLASGIRNGYIDSVSMGCVVQKSVCSICKNEAHTTSEYCDHIKNHKGSSYMGQKVYEINNDVTFDELSWVSVPADSDAKVLEIMARKAMIQKAINRIYGGSN